jgi:hypothetical protein
MRWRPVYALLALVFVALALLRGLLATAAAVPAVQPRVSPTRLTGLPGLQLGHAPWSRNVGMLRARLALLGLPALAQEGTVLHIHQHLDVLVNGRRVTVPAGIGIDVRGRFISPIHTHDSTGIVHVESPVVRGFTLGEYFGVWGVRLSSRCLGGYCAGNGKTLRAYVDGRLQQGDPRRIPLTSHEEIALVFGAAHGRQPLIPRTYDFPFGY